MTDPTNTLPTPYQSGRLKPCPYCGSAPVIMTRPFYRWRLYFIKCGQIQKDGSKGCTSSWFGPGYDTVFSREKAIRRWNREVDRTIKEMNRQSKNQWVEENYQEGQE